MRPTTQHMYKSFQHDRYVTRVTSLRRPKESSVVILLVTRTLSDAMDSQLTIQLRLLVSILVQSVLHQGGESIIGSQYAQTISLMDMCESIRPVSCPLEDCEFWWCHPATYVGIRLIHVCANSVSGHTIQFIRFFYDRSMVASPWM